MKNKITKMTAAFCFSACMLLMMGCPPNTNTKDKQKSDSLSSKKPVMRLMSDTSALSDLCNASVYSNAIHEIDTTEAKDHIWKFVKNFGTDPDVAYNGWSEINRHELSFFETAGSGGGGDTSVHCGLMIYFCYKPQTNYFYLAYQIAPDYNNHTDPFPLNPQPDLLGTSVCWQKFSDAEKLTPEANAEAVRNYRSLCTAAPGAETYALVNADGTEFMNHINGLNPSFPGIVVFPVGFYHKNQVHDLITQNDASHTATDKCSGIRVYFGMDDSVTPALIKAVTFAIDGNGGNIWKNFDGVHKAIILQKSWPPQ